jgi:hypothetical protein
MIDLFSFVVGPEALPDPTRRWKRFRPVPL